MLEQILQFVSVFLGGYVGAGGVHYFQVFTNYAEDLLRSDVHSNIGRVKGEKKTDNSNNNKILFIFSQ